jgi:hypothetical protein
MKAHLSNAVYGIVDYIAYPIGMLVAASAKTSLFNSQEVCA